MSLIKPLIKEKRKPLSVQLEEPAYDRFIAYCGFLGEKQPRSYVAQKMIERVLDTDRDFIAWQAAAGKGNGKVHGR